MPQVEQYDVHAAHKERLQQYPAGWVYAGHERETQDKFIHDLILPLLAEEAYFGTSDITQLLELTIQTFRCLTIKVWLDDVRKSIQQMLKAEQFIADNDLLHIQELENEARDNFAEIKARLEQAQVDLMVAEENVRRRSAEHRQYLDAQEKLEDVDVYSNGAFHLLCQLRDEN